LIFGGVFGAIALALILAIVLTGSDSDEPAADNVSEFGDPTVNGDHLPIIDQTTVGSNDDPAIGMAIPEVSGQSFDGSAVSIERDGEAKAILFVSHSCPHCQDEIPAVQTWLDETGGVDGIDIISVSTAASEITSNWPPSEWLSDAGWTSPVIADDADSSAFAAYGGVFIPYWVFVDADGNVTRRFAGRLDVEIMELAMLEALS
jgi:thiol-disulfide isomerase/thioredoxin